MVKTTDKVFIEVGMNERKAALKLDFSSNQTPPKTAVSRLVGGLSSGNLFFLVANVILSGEKPLIEYPVLKHPSVSFSDFQKVQRYVL